MELARYDLIRFDSGRSGTMQVCGVVEGMIARLEAMVKKNEARVRLPPM